jgi:hypothetical protein
MSDSAAAPAAYALGAAQALTVGSVGVVAGLLAPSGGFLQVALPRAALFPSGLGYTVGFDASGLASWTASATASASAVTISGLLASGAAAWIGVPTVAELPFTYAGAPRTLRVSPGAPLAAVGASGAVANVLWLHAAAYTARPEATPQQVYGSQLAALTAAYGAALSAGIKAALELPATQAAVLGALMEAAGPVLDLSTPGARTLALGGTSLPALVLTTSLLGAAVTYTVSKLNATRQLAFPSIPFAMLIS